MEADGIWKGKDPNLIHLPVNTAIGFRHYQHIKPPFHLEDIRSSSISDQEMPALEDGVWTCCKNYGHEAIHCTSCLESHNGQRTRLERDRNVESVYSGPPWGRGWFWVSTVDETTRSTSKTAALTGTAHPGPSPTSATSAAAPASGAAPRQVATHTTVPKSEPAVAAVAEAAPVNTLDNMRSRRRRQTLQTVGCNFYECDSYMCDSYTCSN